MNRLEWQQLAERWLADAKGLLDDHRWAAAYYTAGYSVECGLKACVLARLAATPEAIFESRRFGENCWTHDARILVKQAGLESVRAADIATNLALAQNWFVIKDWSEESRYQNTPHHKAKKLYTAITDKPNGVMQWIRTHW